MDNNTFYERAGAIIIIVCAFAFLFAIGIHCFNNKPPKPLAPIELVVHVDTTGNLTNESKVGIDSLVYRLDKQEKLLEDKYQYLLEQKENINDILTYGGMLIAVVISIFGFFGYKSINSIEERAEKQASQKAEQTATSILNAKYQEYQTDVNRHIDRGIESKLDENVDRKVAESRKTLKNYITDKVKKEARAYSNNIENLENKIEPINTSIQSLDEKMTKLDKRLSDLETSKPDRVRRTLTNRDRFMDGNTNNNEPSNT